MLFPASILPCSAQGLDAADDHRGPPVENVIAEYSCHHRSPPSTIIHYLHRVPSLPPLAADLAPRLDRVLCGEELAGVGLSSLGMKFTGLSASREVLSVR